VESIFSNVFGRDVYVYISRSQEVRKSCMEGFPFLGGAPEFCVRKDVYMLVGFPKIWELFTGAEKQETHL